MKRQCQAVYYAFDILWLNGARSSRPIAARERKKILRSAIPRKSACVGYVSYVDRQAMKLFEMIKKGDLEGLERKDGKYSQRTLWYKILNPTYTQKAGRYEFFQRQ